MNSALLALIAGAAVVLLFRNFAVIAIAAVVIYQISVHNPAGLRWVGYAVLFGFPALLLGGRIALRDLSEFEYRTRAVNTGRVNGLWRWLPRPRFLDRP